MFKQYGIELSRKTMADWMIKSSELLIPIYQRLKTIQLQQSVINADETPLKVIHNVFRPERVITYFNHAHWSCSYQIGIFLYHPQDPMPPQTGCFTTPYGPK